MFIGHGRKEICNNAELIHELKKLNPDVTFVSDNPDVYVVVNCEPSLLKLPKPFYLSEKNGITNKHNTKSGMYITLDVVC